MSRLLRCVLVGDSGCGKTSLLRRYIHGVYHEYSDPTTACEGHFARIYWNNSISLELWDSSGEDDYKRLRTVLYKTVDILIICFAVNSPRGFRNINQHWLREIRKTLHHSIPIILVATKVDLRDRYRNLENVQSFSEVCIDYAQGFSLAKEIGAVAYIECSALKNSGLELLFDTVAASGLYYRPQETGETLQCKCSVM